MKIVSARDANRSFAKLLSEVENGETVRSDDPRDDPAWRTAYERMVELMRAWPDRGYRVGKIAEDDKYGDAVVTGGRSFA